jgi:hypothetical protein
MLVIPLFFSSTEEKKSLPPHVLLPSLQLSQKVQEEECPPLESRINALLKLEEVRAQAKTEIGSAPTNCKKLV